MFVRVIFVAVVYAAGAALVPGGLPLAHAVQAEGALPRFDELEANVAFWRDVFAKYTKNELVFHDPYFLDVIYAVEDVGHLIRGDGNDPATRRAIRAHIDQTNARLASAIRHLDVGEPRNDEESRIAAVLAKAGAKLPSARELASRIRAQRGLADELCGSIARARPFLPEMKRILAAHGVPTELASLPLVESGYRTHAHSHAAAAGMWQFTRSTGRRYLRIDHVVDERRDPLRATEAAARYLRSNYEMLGSWPLAITAYNHGEAGIAAAVRAVGSRDLGRIVEHYRGRAFGFASRNFYAEFLAAHEIMQEADKYCPQPAIEAAALPDHVEIGAYVPFKELAECAGVDPATLAELNPALQPDVARGRLYVPKGYRLWLPSGARARFERAYAALPSSVIYGGQPPYYAHHRVRPGQTLSHIAALYHTSVGSLQRHNGIRDPRRLRAGQVLKVPVRGLAASGGSPARASAPSRDTAESYIVHRVARGETLSHIATRYRVDVASLQRYNGIADPRSLRVGQRVKVPGKRAATVARTHTVQRGQTLSQIARLYRTSVSRLQAVNGIRDPRKLRSGQVLRLPD